MKVKFKVKTGYAGARYESDEIEVQDDTTEEELQEMAVAFMLGSCNIEAYYEIIEE